MELPKLMVKYISTKVNDEAEAVKTKLTLDLSLLTWLDVLEYAIMALVVKWQGTARRAKGGIPSFATYVVPKPGTRAQIDPRETAINQLIASGYTREVATFILDNAPAVKTAAEAEAEVEE